eukprot:TRINITY_DN19496_c0_g1_i1.p1 TRINITY_DN19496_c0_g1~~TRINITY_DN19496_c0_g1_i1.p1  ORF type:complete len:261 (-),score=70.08 TRINITY_DN19496_c0_g1_i1:17-799(-)
MLDDPQVLAEERTWRKLLLYDLRGLDVRRRPVMIEAVGRWNMELLDAEVRRRPRSLLRSHLAVCEMLLRQSCADGAAEMGGAGAAPTPRAAPAFRRWVVIFDMEGLSLRHVRHAGVLSSLKEISAMDELYYPDTIEHVFIVNTPAVFFLVWRIVARFVNADTQAKVHVLPRGDFRELLEECGRDCLPPALGGAGTPSAALEFAADAALLAGAEKPDAAGGVACSAWTGGYMVLLLPFVIAFALSLALAWVAGVATAIDKS